MVRPLSPIVVRAPGFRGLNLEGESVVSDPAYARVLENAVFDAEGRIAARKGYSALTDLSGAGDVESLFMYDYSGGSILIADIDDSGSEIWDSDSPYSSATDVSGTATVGGNNWQFVNFNGKVIGVRQGDDPIVKTGTGNFADITAASGSLPQGNCVCSAFGRLWAPDGNGTDLKYCALLDETHWTTGAGEINILGQESAVRHGYDTITAIAPLADKLVVFLENSIVIFDSPESPGSLAINNVIQGIGCVSRDSVQQVGDDLVFLDRSGLRSLARSALEENLPLRELSSRVKGDLIQDASVDYSQVKSAYVPEDGFYLLLTPAGYVWAFDFKDLSDQGQPRVTRWYTPTWHSLHYHEGVLYIGQEGEIGKYDGYQEDGANYSVRYRSAYVDFDSPAIKMLKKYALVIEGAGAQSITAEWETDYGLGHGSETQRIPTGYTVAEFDGQTDSTTADSFHEFGTAEFGLGVDLNRLQGNMSNAGEVVSFGFSIPVTGSSVAVEQMSLFAKAGRLAR